jgi:hypothetical protein
LKSIISFAARQKFRFDLGQSFMAVINFAFVVIAASDKLAMVLDMPIKVILAIIVPSSVVCVWFMGWSLDKAGFYHAYQNEQNRRNAMLYEALKARNPGNETAVFPSKNV